MRILVRRTSGHGDILSLTSVIPGLQKKYPGAEIYFKTTRGFDQLIRHDPRIAGIIWHGRGTSDSEFDLVIRVDHASTWGIDTEEKRIWMPLAQCRIAGVEFNPPKMYLLPEEITAVEDSDVALANKYPLGGRSYQRMPELARLLVREGYKVRQIDNSPLLCRGVDDPPLTIREAAAEVARTRCLVTVDSAFLHVGAGLGKSMVVIFNQEQRTSQELQYVPDCWIADWHCKPRRILAMVKHLLSNGPAPDEENTFGPAYKESQS